MSNCRVRKGFFVLRDCGLPAGITCTGCARRVCEAHVDTATRECVECRAKKKDLSWRDDGYAAGRRGDYYRRTRYSPIYWGAFHHDPYYSNYHVRDFDDAADVDGTDGDVAGDFHDS